MDINSDIELYSYRNKGGRPRIFESPEEMIEIWDKYVFFCLNTPLKQVVVQKVKVSRDEEEIKKVKVPHIRPFNLRSFCLFAEFNEDTFREYEKREEFIGITTHIRDACYSQKFDGAACGFYNANLIALELGMRNKQEQIEDFKITIEKI